MKNKKLMISLFSLCLVVIVGLLTTVIVLAAGTQNVNSSINVVYQASEISGTVSAGYKKGGQQNYTAFTTNGQSEGGDTSITFAANKPQTTHTLSPVGLTALTSTEREVIFKYTFQNNGGSNHSWTATVVFNAGSGNTPDNYSMTYCDTEDGTYGSTNSVQVTGGQTKNLFIKVRIADPSKDMTLAGTFAWTLSLDD